MNDVKILFAAAEYDAPWDKIDDLWINRAILENEYFARADNPEERIYKSLRRMNKEEDVVNLTIIYDLPIGDDSLPLSTYVEQAQRSLDKKQERTRLYIDNNQVYGMF